MNAFVHLYRKLLSCIFLLCFFTTLLAQKRMPFDGPSDFSSTQLCAIDGLLNGLRKDAQFKAREEQMNRDILRVMGTLGDDAVTLPVVFHIISNNPSSVTDIQILNALQDLNDAFAKTGKYSGSKGADTKIRFCLAQKAPDGGLTKGITRTKSFFSNHLNSSIEDKRLKKLVQWDPAHYINIWYVASIEKEISAEFSCGMWSRLFQGGYATMPPGGGPTDGVVVTGFGALLAHEMGHYLGLYHTFEGLNCRNNDCKTDGDKVCDTPPDATRTGSCGSASNSCSSDTLSGFTVDVPDRVENFMDYGNGSCATEFTEGQAERMRAAIATQRSGLLQDACTKPCTENITAAFLRNITYPVTGDVMQFTSIATGAVNYEWLVDNAVVSTDAHYTHTFSTPGTYKLTLKAYNTPSCYATYSENIIVTCGVTARFYTNKQTIASKFPVYTDSILFTNTSENAVSYQWIMSNDSGMVSQVVSTSKNLNYVFQKPAEYSVQLIAGNGSCFDTTDTYTVPVHDPTQDAAIYLYDIICSQNTKVRLTFYVCNNGYAPMPANTPVSFYDADPRLGGAALIGSYLLPNEITGRCCSPLYTYVIDVKRPGLNLLYAVVNDNGTTSPLQLPNTSMPENYYSNNIASLSNFRFKVSAIPSSATLEPGDTLQLRAQAGPGSVASYVWSPPVKLSCTNCAVTDLIADSNRVKQVIATSALGCRDTAYADIKVPPADDYTITINKVRCAANDSLYVNFNLYNHFKRGVLPRDLKVSFYSGDPSSGNATLLLPVYSLKDTVKLKQFTFSTYIKAMPTGSLYAVVNDAGTAIPISLPNTAMLEKNYANNGLTYSYQPEKLIVQPSDTTIFRKSSFTLNISSPVFDPSTTTWFGGNHYNLSCLQCPAPVATVMDSAVIRVQTANEYGCMIKGQANIKVFPPDLTVEILDTKCYTNKSTLVRFKVCMNNNYDSIFTRLPVAFYNIDTATHKASLLQPVFYTTALQAGNCAVFTHKVTTPPSGILYAVVNDKGSAIALPQADYEETDYSNNTAQTIVPPFRVDLPADTTVSRFETVLLQPQVSGGIPTSYSWRPSQFLSCTDCLNTTAAAPYTTDYQLFVQNEYACTDTASIVIKTFTGGTLNMPTAFTPDGDGLNDIFYVMASREARQVKDFSIFNRWGQKVFQVQNVLANDPHFGWNGSFNGKPATPDVYVYVVSMSFDDHPPKIYKGTVLLIR